MKLEGIVYIIVGNIREQLIGLLRQQSESHAKIVPSDC